MRPVSQVVGENLPITVRPDAVRRDPPVACPVELGEVVANASFGFPDGMRLPLWIELTDGERTVHVQASSAWRQDGRILLRAEVEP